MIGIFGLSLALEIFMIYFGFKIVSWNLDVPLWAYLYFFFWSFFLCLPPVIAVFLGDSAMSESEKLKSYLGKYANYCVSDSTMLMVAELSR